MQTKQLDFWSGEFGKNYVTRNVPDHKTMAGRIDLWSKIFTTLKPDNLSNILETLHLL